MSLTRILALAVWIVTVPAIRAEAADDEFVIDQQQVRYVPLQPSFVVNFGNSDNGDLMFVKADVSIRVHSVNAATAVMYHAPALRNAIVLLLSRQDEASVSSGSGREAIRAEALAELRGILEKEEGDPYIEDVLFTNFLVQR